MTNEELVKTLREYADLVETNSYEVPVPVTLLEDLRVAALAPERRKWIPVTERLPENGERVLAYCKDRAVHDAKWSWPQNEWFDKVTGNTYFESFVTHWVPLPEAPEVE